MRQNHLEKILNKQFKIADIKLQYKDICDNKVPNWYQKYSCTEEQNQKWQKWTMKYIKEKMNFTKDKAFIEASWINLNYGLKIKNGKKNKPSL
jgi:hypothetical protein